MQSRYSKPANSILILESYESSSGLKHGVDAGYTSIENAIQHILRIPGETPLYEGKSWHKDLIDRVTPPMKGSNARPAFFDQDLRDDLLEYTKVRHLVRYGDYGEFDPGKAGPSADAVRLLVARFRQAVAEFRAEVDPDPDAENDGGDGAGGGASGELPI